MPLFLLTLGDNNPETSPLSLFRIYAFTPICSTMLLQIQDKQLYQSLNHLISKITPLMGNFNPIRLQISNNIFNFVIQLHYKPYKSMT